MEIYLLCYPPTSDQNLDHHNIVKNFGLIKNITHKKFWSQEILAEKILVEKDFCSKKVFDQKIFAQKLIITFNR